MVVGFQVPKKLVWNTAPVERAAHHAPCPAPADQVSPAVAVQVGQPNVGQADRRPDVPDPRVERVPMEIPANTAPLR